MSIEVPRRSFLVALGLAASGLALAPVVEAAPGKKDGPKPKEGGFRPNVFVHVASSGVVSIVCSRSEMGQGVRSSLPPLIADELGADMARVVVVQGDGDKAYGDQNTDGSRSVRMDFDKLRKVGAAARMMLVEAAARTWGVAASTLTVANGAVLHAATKRSLGFGELANAAAALPIPKDDKIVLRPRSEWKWLGKDLPLLDAPAIVTGQAVFGADVRIPGMLIAVIARPPVVGGKVARFDATKTLAIPGVKKVVELPVPTGPVAFQPLGGLAVVADGTWAAMRGRHALDVTWDHGDNAVYDSGAYRKMLAETVSKPGKEARNVGDAGAALATAPKRLEALYETPHLPHATMEPPVTLANVTGVADGMRVEIWAATQNPQAARKEAARALGIDESKITVHVTLLGGGFGRKSKADFVAEAVLVSRAMNAPVRVQWTREDDIQHDYYHATSAQRLEAGIDAENDVVAWQHRTAFPPIASIFTGTDMAGRGRPRPGRPRYAARHPERARRELRGEGARAHRLASLGRERLPRVRDPELHRRARPRARKGPARQPARPARSREDLDARRSRRREEPELRAVPRDAPGRHRPAPARARARDRARALERSPEGWSLARRRGAPELPHVRGVRRLRGTRSAAYDRRGEDGTVPDPRRRGMDRRGRGHHREPGTRALSARGRGHLRTRPRALRRDHD